MGKGLYDSTGSVGTYRYYDVYSVDSLKTELIIAGFIICLLFAGCCTLIGFVWPVTERNPCVEGDSLNGFEQVWCAPKHKSTVNVTRTNGTGIELYRLKKKNIAANLTRLVHVMDEFNITADLYKYYSFVLMKGSSVRADLTSNVETDDWYLVDFDNYESFQKGHSFASIESSKGTLSVAFEAVQSDTYFLLVDHHQGDARITFDMSFEYLVFDINLSTIPPSCQDEVNCTFEDVGEDEVIIADNSHEEEWSLEMDLPPKINVIAAIFLFGFLAITGVGVFFSIGFFILSVYDNCKNPHGRFDERAYLKGSSSVSKFYSQPNLIGGIDGNDDEDEIPSQSPSLASVNSDILQEEQ